MARQPKDSKDRPALFRTEQLMRLVFAELKSRGGAGRPKEVLAAVAKVANITPHEAESTEWFKARGLVGPRWETNVRFWTTTFSRAGFLKKSGGVWELTEAGEKALKLPEGELIREADRRYKDSIGEREESEIASPPKVVDEGELQEPSKAILDKAEEDARAAIDARIDALGAYEFQDMVAELLRAMGYYVRQVAPPGADGGIDILAFRDPLGTQPPHIKVQVKHRQEQKMDVREIRQLAGILHKDSDIGLLVSSNGFTRDADREIAQASKHLDRIDRDRLIELWIEHYEKLSERGKKFLPLVPVYFLAPSEG